MRDFLDGTENLLIGFSMAPSLLSIFVGEKQSECPSERFFPALLPQIIPIALFLGLVLRLIGNNPTSRNLGTASVVAGAIFATSRFIDTLLFPSDRSECEMYSGSQAFLAGGTLLILSVGLLLELLKIRYQTPRRL